MQEQRPHPAQPFHPQPQRPASPGPAGPARIAPPPMRHDMPVDLEPLELIDDEPTPAPVPVAGGAPIPGALTPSQGPSKIRQFGTSIGNVAHQENFKRPTIATGNGAVRVRTFHGRLSDEGLTYMDSKINEWLDAHPDIEVKFATTTIGLYESKIKEQALIVNIWY